MEPVIGGVLFILVVGLIIIFGGNQEDVPRDEMGRPMKACFGSRGTRFCWVRQSSPTVDQDK
ncbi:hypothetical protein HN858_04940 [Candidatus Falkowbacteria bacterium]|nr:hypothetical protein [Candidatus Falkowbacteria bacterium]MBT6574515.1 hypothetical protein [Candidatus Falkowbacteria bacterium]MBT7348985.1 hypothetical protein [Candidatus Falkowbacteria bacterium]MBT7500580.1 hypothetical protein [Candidatus Falkowbacteria bacterium]